MSYYDDDGNIVDGTEDDSSKADQLYADTDTTTAAASNGNSSANADTAAADAVAADVAEMKRRLQELENDENEANALAESAALSHSQSHSHHQTSSSSQSASAAAAAAAFAVAPDLDDRSVYVGNVDYSTTTDELQSLFSACGVVNRVTILVDKISGHPKGYAYVEFQQADSVMLAVKLDETEFKGRLLSVKPKRTNVPAFALGRGRGRGRGRGGRGGYRGGYAPVRGGGRFTNRRGSYTPY